jgi:pSer/pThr/pTyr-binding forkhead associated (FHA) protein
MANVKVPLKFQIFRGDELLREDVLSEPVIKVGKLASSHLRLDDDSVSRMHAVVEVGGPDDVQLIDLGSTRGTLVNGEKITKARLRPGDEISFGDVRVVISFVAEGSEVEDSTVVAPHVAAAAAAQPAARPAPTVTAPIQVPPPAPFAPPPSAYGAPPPHPGRTTSGHSIPSAAAYSAPASFAPPQVNPVAAEVEVHDGARAIEVQAIYKGVVTNTRHLYDAGVKALSSKARAMILGGAALLVLASGVFLATVIDVGSEKTAYEAHLNAGKEAKTFHFKPRTPAPDAIVFLGWAAGIDLV